jgi:hypothetical protein
MEHRRSRITRAAPCRQAQVLEVQPVEMDRWERSRELASEPPAGGKQRKRLAKTGGLARPDFNIKQAFDRRTVEPKKPSCVGGSHVSHLKRGYVLNVLLTCGT